MASAGAGTWRLIDSGAGPGPWNLALDDAIFRCVRERCSPPTLRFYAWSAPALSLGYAQDRGRDVDLAECRRQGIPVLRRASGGRAVLHDREITYSVAIPAGTALFGSGLDAAYRAVARGLLEGLLRLGVRAAAGQSRGGGPRQAGCFAAAARHEITVAGRKLVGSAQRRREGAFLQHGSLLISGHGGTIARLLAGGGAGDAGAMVGLADLLDPCPAHEAIAAALADGCAAAWGVRMEPGVPSPRELALAGDLAVGRYRSEAWNAGAREAGSR